MNLKVKHPLLAAPASIGGLDLKNKIILDLSKATTSTFLESTDWKKNPIKI